MAHASSPLVHCLRWARPSPNARLSAESLSNFWSVSRIICGHPRNAPSVCLECRLKSWVRREERTCVGQQQLKNRSAAGTLLVRERPFLSRLRPFRECSARQRHRSPWPWADQAGNGFERMKVLVTGSSGLIGSEAVQRFDRHVKEVGGVDNNMVRGFFLAVYRYTLKLGTTEGVTQRLN